MSLIIKMASCVPHQLAFPGGTRDGKTNFEGRAGSWEGDVRHISGEKRRDQLQGQLGICPCAVRKTRWQETRRAGLGPSETAAGVAWLSSCRQESDFHDFHTLAYFSSKMASFPRSLL